MTFNKKILAHTSAGVAAILLVAFGVTQCQRDNDARAELDDTKSQYENAAAMLQTRDDENKKLDADNRAKGDTIVAFRDSIKTLNNSLDVVNKDLDDCQKSKKQVPVKKPVKKKESVKPAPKKRVVKSDPNTDVSVSVDNSSVVNGRVNVVNGDNGVSRGNVNVTVANSSSVNGDVDIVNGNGVNVTVDNNSVVNGGVNVNTGTVNNYYQEAEKIVVRYKRKVTVDVENQR